MRNKLIRMAVVTAGLTGTIATSAAMVAPSAHAAALVYTSKTPCDSSYHQVIVGTGPYGTLIYACYK